MSPAARAERLTEENIGRLVDEFYTRIRADAVLGPVFLRAIPGDWGPHLATMRDFWSSVMLGSRRYKGNPVAAHARVAGVEPEMFGRWLQLFGETCDEIFDDEIAAGLRLRAARIAESLSIALFYRPEGPRVGRVA